MRPVSYRDVNRELIRCEVIQDAFESNNERFLLYRMTRSLSLAVLTRSRSWILVSYDPVAIAFGIDFMPTAQTHYSQPEAK